MFKKYMSENQKVPLYIFLLITVYAFITGNKQKNQR